MLTLKNVTKKYSKNLILQNINIEVFPGEIIGLIGKNGSGKTTLLTILSQLPIKFEGDVKYSNYIKKEDISSLIETPDFFSYLSGKENLMYFVKIKQINHLEKNCDELLKIVSLFEKRNVKFSEYSLGMKQRLGIALSLMNNPKLLILDEPFNGIDPEGVVELRNLLINLNKNKNITIIISSHILTDLYKICKRFIFINNHIIVKDIRKNDLESTLKNTETIEDYYISLINKGV
ncbi:ABC transporter ATP-binding protein [Macrococcus animalis]|uniref:ABC transporter ATP-binding protein n=1 Tax=Macrococcus animalis TaxID=3395467 RepID=UPI0039BE021B